jgi:hypothetical protein
MHITLIGYAILFLLLYVWSKTSFGYKAIYSALVLTLLLLLVGHGKDITNIMVEKN